MEILHVEKIYPIKKGRSIKFRHINAVKYLCFHHTGSTKLSLPRLYSLHTDELHQWATIGYHLYITKSGIIYQVNSYTTIVNGCTNFNSNVIHVCIEGNYKNEILLPSVMESINFVAYLLRGMLPGLQITYHSRHKNTLCPGQNVIKYLESNIIPKINKDGLIWPDLEN